MSSILEYANSIFVGGSLIYCRVAGGCWTWEPYTVNGKPVYRYHAA